jgi:uncharacterized protein YigE (DUF2233 family)
LGILLVLGLVAVPRLRADDGKWQKIAKGLDVAVFDSPRKSVLGDSKITVVRIDPSQYEFRLLCALEHGKRSRTAKEWCQEFGLVCAMNASMYGKDGLTPVGYVKHRDRFINPRLTKDKTIVAFGRLRADVPEVQIIDLQYQDLKLLSASYGVLVQNIRMISRKGENVWTQQPRIWSMSIMGMDKNGKALFLFTRSPYSVHDFAAFLMGLPLALFNATYLDGGPPASLYLSADGVEMNLFGSYETGVRENDDAIIPWRMPNVIGAIKKRERVEK